MRENPILDEEARRRGEDAERALFRNSALPQRLRASASNRRSL
jgi:hypothetical protein